MLTFCPDHNCPPCHPLSVATSPDGRVQVLRHDERSLSLVQFPKQAGDATAPPTTHHVLRHITCPFVPLDLSISGPVALHTKHSSTHVLAVGGVGGVLLYTFNMENAGTTTTTTTTTTSKHTPKHTHHSPSESFQAALHSSTSTCKVAFSNHPRTATTATTTTTTTTAAATDCHLASASIGGGVAIWDVSGILRQSPQNKKHHVVLPVWEIQYQCSQITDLGFSWSNQWLAFACRTGDVYFIEKEQDNRFRHARVMKRVKHTRRGNGREGDVDTKGKSAACIGRSLVGWVLAKKKREEEKGEEEKEEKKKEEKKKEKEEKEVAEKRGEKEVVEKGKGVDDTDGGMDVFVGVEGPTQRWHVLYPSKGGVRGWKDMKMLDKVHQGEGDGSVVVNAGDVVVGLRRKEGGGLVSVTNSGRRRCFDVEFE